MDHMGVAECPTALGCPGIEGRAHGEHAVSSAGHLACLLKPEPPHDAEIMRKAGEHAVCLNGGCHRRPDALRQVEDCLSRARLIRSSTGQDQRALGSGDHIAHALDGRPVGHHSGHDDDVRRRRPIGSRRIVRLRLDVGGRVDHGRAVAEPHMPECQPYILEGGGAGPERERSDAEGAHEPFLIHPLNVVAVGERGFTGKQDDR